MNRPLQIALPFEVPTSSAIAPTSIAIAPASVELAPTAPAFAPTSVEFTPTHVPLAPFYFVRHRRARRYLLRVEPDGRLRITIPRGGSKREAQAFATRNEAWIAGQRARALAQPPAYAVVERASLRARATEELPARLRELADRHGVTGLTRVSVRSQRTRWGSCGRDGHISLNWRLVLMPAEVRDYVLIHELMHLRRMDHSPAYWQLVAHTCPEYQVARAWLRTHGRTLR